MRAGIAKTTLGDANIACELSAEQRVYKNREEKPAWVYELALRTDEQMRAQPSAYPIWPNLSPAKRRRICAHFASKQDDILDPPFQSAEFDENDPLSAKLFLRTWPWFTPLEVFTVNSRASKAAIKKSFGEWLDKEFKRFAPPPRTSRRPTPWRYLEAIDDPLLDPSMRSKAIHKLPSEFITPEIRSLLRSVAKV